MYVAGHGVDSNDYMKGDFSMTKMKKICIPVLAAAALAFSVPGTTQEAEASCNTYRVNVVTGYLALELLVTGMYTLLSMTISDT